MVDFGRGEDVFSILKKKTILSVKQKDFQNKSFRRHQLSFLEAIL